jgi:hypothetical protein
MPPLTDREMRMLLALIEAEVKDAEAHQRHWQNQPDDSAPNIDEERAFSRGFATGVTAMKNLIDQVLNA